RRLRRIGLIAAFCVSTDLWMLRAYWLHPAFDPGQIAWGFFETFDDGVRLVTDGFYGRSANEYMAPTTDAGLWIAPGKPLVLRLGPASNFTVTTVAEGRAPYVVLGELVPLETTSPANTAAQVLADGQRLVVGGEGLSLAMWDPTLPWEEDSRILRQ